MFWMMFFIALAFSVVGELIRPKQKFDRAKPSAIGDFQFPTTDPTRVLPVFWGTCKIKGPNTSWFGDLKSVLIQKKVKTGWFSSSKVDQGFQYYLGAQLVFSYGQIDELVDFGFDDKSVLSGTSVTDHGDYWSFTMNKPTLIGNDDPKEGVTGPVKIYKGTMTQPANSYLRTRWGEVETSGFRPFFYAVLEQCYLGNSDTPPPPYVIARRTPNPLGLVGGMENIGGDANFASMCYEIMTNQMFGIKISPARIDTASFIACAVTTFNESFGLSMMVDTPMSGRELLADILRHVDGVIYPDPQTGLYTMKLARGGYDESTLPAFDESNTDAETFEFSRVSWEDTKSTIVVMYTDRSRDFTQLPAEYKDQANVYVRHGQEDSEQIEFLGISNKSTAMLVAARASRTRSSPLCRVQFNTDRRGYSLRPCDVVKFSRADLGLSNIILRIVDISYGTLDDPAVKVVAAEDVFSTSVIVYAPPEDTGWLDPAISPTPLLYSRLEEIPYKLIGDESRRVMALGVRSSTSRSSGFDIWSDPTGGTVYTPTGHADGTIPGGVLTADYLVDMAVTDDPVGFTIAAVQDKGQIDSITLEERNLGLRLVLCGNEIMAWQTSVHNVDNTVTISNVLRGVLDTVPENHYAGTTVYFLGTNLPQVAGTAYAADTTVNAKLLTFVGNEVLPVTEAPMLSVVTDHRAERPDAPGRVRVNAALPGAPITGPFVLSWAHRNKAAPGVVSQDATDVTPARGTTYLIEIFEHLTDTFIVSRRNIASAPATINIQYTGQVRVELSSVNADGERSRYPQKVVFLNTANGSASSILAADAGPSIFSEPNFDPVRIVVEVPITLSGLKTLSGGVALQIGDRVLVDGQDNDAENGIYVVAEGAWARAADADRGLDFFTGKPVYIKEGLQANISWRLLTQGDVTLGVTLLNFAPVGEEVIMPVAIVGGYITIDCSLAEHFSVNLTADAEIRFINVPNSDRVALLDVKQKGAFNITMPVNVSPVGGIAYVSTKIVDAVDLLGFLTDSRGVQWLLRYSLNINVLAGGSTVNAFAVTVSPNPAYGYAADNPSIAVAATAVNGTAPITISWSRAAGGVGDWGGSASNVGGASPFTISNAASFSPTFSRTGTADGYVAQNWLATVTDATGLSATSAPVEIALEDDGIVGGGGGGGGGWRCVAIDAWVMCEGALRRAKDIRAHIDRVLVINPITRQERFALVSVSEPAQEQGYAVRTAAGVVLTCSGSAPLATPEGPVDANQSKDRMVLIRIDGQGYRWSMVYEVESLGLIWVQKITCDNNYFLAGDNMGEYLAHHNLKYEPDGPGTGTYYTEML